MQVLENLRKHINKCFIYKINKVVPNYRYTKNVDQTCDKKFNVNLI